MTGPKPDVPLLTYDDSQFELGMVPWQTFEEHLEGCDISPDIHQKVIQALARANLRATERFQDSSIEQQDYEVPFLFVTDSTEVFKSVDLDKNSRVDIALDTLHGFIAAGAFKREFIRRDDLKDPAYYRGVGEVTRRPIIEFVNRHVAAVINS